MKKFLSVLLAVLMLIGTVSTIPAIAAEDTAAAGWNGTQVTEPEGSGTKEDPFRIASAANLYWVSRQIGTGDGTGTYDPFAGMYLLQTADIDLNGKTMKSVGYYSNVGGGGTAATVYHVFGGTYDGNGYTVRNGTFASMNNGAGKNYNWSTGMFGIIMDATIKNVTLENITVSTTTSSTAYLVGSTVGKNNLIENCVVKDTCNMVFSIGKDPSDWCEIGSPASVGGIVGYTGGDTVVRNCVNQADLTFGKYVTKAGGIVGTARLKTTVENCVNTGDIVETVDVSDTREDHYAGGIMGGIHSGKIYYNGNTIPVGDVSISGCYNAGTLVVESALAGKKRSVSWGGILGAMVGGNENCKYTIANCYNLAQSVKLSYCDDLNTLAEEEKNVCAFRRSSERSIAEPQPLTTRPKSIRSGSSSFPAVPRWRSTIRGMPLYPCLR